MKMVLLALLTSALQLLVEQEQRVLMACRVMNYIITHQISRNKKCESECEEKDNRKG